MGKCKSDVLPGEFDPSYCFDCPMFKSCKGMKAKQKERDRWIHKEKHANENWDRKIR